MADDTENDLYTAAAQSLRSIDRTALVNREEMGIETSFITSHRMAWDATGTSKATPNAPIMMAPVSSRALGGSQADFELLRVGDWEINETLLLFWEEQYGMRFDRDQLDALVEDQQGDPAVVAQQVHSGAVSTGLLKDVKLIPGVVVGNFKYQKMPMVRDLEQNIDALAANDLIAAIAGDQDAIVAVRNGNDPGGVDERLPNFIPPDNEFLVLDAGQLTELRDQRCFLRSVAGR